MTPGDRSGWLAAGRPKLSAVPWPVTTRTRCEGLLGPLAPILVRLTPPPGEPPPWLDCDTPEDLRRARDLAGPH